MASTEGGTAARNEQVPNLEHSRSVIRQGHTALGIELGSTRIKACLIDTEDPSVILAVGGCGWENQLTDRLWTYSLKNVWVGIAAAYAELAAEVRNSYGVELEEIGAIGVSAMMHGYLAFDEKDELLVPFRTWRNTNTETAAAELTELLGVNIPLRWSIAHFRQAMLDHEPHVPHVRFLTTLAGYVHWRLTGERVLGVGDASGMFPIDPLTHDYDAEMAQSFDALMADASLECGIMSLMPRVLVAGEPAGRLTAEGTTLLDPTGRLSPGIRLCPPEGDAGTGMVATDAVKPRTGNVSCGTSIFAMIVLERPLSQVHPELDLVTTPAGDAVAMVHCNNGASELASWVGMFSRFAEAAGMTLGEDHVYEVLFREALGGEKDAGGLLAYNYLAGEPITDTSEGRPLFVRTPDSRLTLANAMRAQLYGVFGTLALGMRTLLAEGVVIDRMFAHGGMFRTPGVAQRFLASALRSPVAVGQSASEGGAWGMALLAAYSANREDQSLAEFLERRAFNDTETVVVEAGGGEVDGFARFLKRYEAGLAIERAAIAAI